MARSAVLDVKILVDAAKAATGLNETASKFEAFGKKLGNAVIGAAAIGGVTALAKTVVSSASTMQQAMGGTDKVFGSSASEIHSWAKDTTDSIRLPAAAVEQYATLIKTQLSATGQPMDQLVKGTKDLIQVGADLSAVTGQDLASSIQAVKSALAGEYDPIQNLGVAMSGASVQARALSIAHGDATLAASDAVIMQARVAEIMEKSAFATGAAAEEADSFQGRMDALKEQTSGLAVAIGGPLLDSLSNIVGGMTDAAGGAQTIGTGLGTILGFVLQLPTPILAVAAGLGLLAVVSAKWGASVAGGFATLMTSVRGATTSVGGLKAALSSIGPSLAGGAALLGIGAIIAAVAIAVGRVTEGAKKGEDALQGYRDAIVDAGGASTQATAEAFKLAVTTSDAFKALTEDGFSASEAVGILTGTTENWHDVMAGSLGTVHNLNRDTMTMVDGFIDANGHAKTLALTQLEGQKAMDAQGDSAKQLGPTIAEAEEQGKIAAEKAAEAQKKLADAIKQAQDAANATVVSTALNRYKSDAEDATRAIEFFALTLDKATGGTRALDQAQADWNKSLTSIGEAFKDQTGFVEENKTALLEWNVSALTATPAGQAIFDSLVQVRTGYETVVGAAYAASLAAGDNAGAQAQAKAQADAAYGAFLAQAGAMHLSATETATLAEQLGILDATKLSPAVFQLIADDKQARDAVLAIQATVIGAKNFEITAGADGAMGTVDDVISYTDAAGNAMPPIPITATGKPAEGVADAFTNEKRQTNEVAILANSAPARNAMIAFLNDYSKMTITATLNANTAPARGAMEAFRSDMNGITVTATILGNSAPARSAIAAVENGSYTATVRIVAETSSFFSTFNSLPSAKPVSTSRAGVAPALQGFGAATLSSTSDAPVSARNVTTGGITINVSGAVDPDSTARQIRSLLERRDRRSGGIVI